MKHIAPIFVVLFLTSFYSLLAIDTTQPETELITIKSKLPFISVEDFLYHREPRDFSPDGKVKAAWSILLQLHSVPSTVSALEAQTHHTDADIRVLALLGMVAKETPEVVPACLRLMNDNSATLPNQYEPGGLIPGENHFFTEPQTVSAIARKILDKVGCPLNNIRTEAEAVQWWASRNGNGDWLAWYEFLYKRASQGTTSVQPESKDAIQRFRSSVDSLPAKTRSWILLYLADNVFMNRGIWENDFATEQEMIDAVKSLGADALIEFLQSGRRLGLHDPSLDDRAKGRRFIVTYAPHFFAQQHADTLLKLKLFTAAADAYPSIVRRVAEVGMKELVGKYKGWDRAKVMAALAALGDSDDRHTAIKWFYEEPSEKRSASPQSVFLKEIQQRKPSGWRHIVREIVTQSAFDKLQPIDVMYLARLAEKLDGTHTLITPGYSYENQADATRGKLREMFQIQR